MNPKSNHPHRGPRVAIVHDWLTAFGGAERVLIRLCRLLPQADVFTLFGQHGGLQQALAGRTIKASYLAHLPGIDRYYRWLASLMPRAIEEFRFKDYDLVVSSSWAFAHGIHTEPGTPHLAYIHSPMRWAWDMQEEYLQREQFQGPVRWLVQKGIDSLRQWDKTAAERDKTLIANSEFIRARIERCWHKDSRVIYPPVEIKPQSKSSAPHGAYISVSRLVKYKRVDLWVEAFKHLPQHRLIVVGTGPERAALEKIAPPNVEFTGWVSDERAIELISGARGFLQASKEDFGISVVEAQGYGIPVLAYREGGAAETVMDLDRPNPTGRLFDVLEPEAVAQDILAFERQQFSPQDCRNNAQRFAPEVFDAAITKELHRLGMQLDVRSDAI